MLRLGSGAREAGSGAGLDTGRRRGVHERGWTLPYWVFGCAICHKLKDGRTAVGQNTSTHRPGRPNPSSGGFGMTEMIGKSKGLTFCMAKGSGILI